MNTSAIQFYHGDYIAYVTPQTMTPNGEVVYSWEVQNLTDLDNRRNFAEGLTVGEELTLVECASAARAYRNG